MMIFCKTLAVIVVVVGLCGCSKSVEDVVIRRLGGVVVCKQCGKTCEIKAVRLTKTSWFGKDYLVWVGVDGHEYGETSCPNYCGFGGVYKDGGKEFYIMNDVRFEKLK